MTNFESFIPGWFSCCKIFSILFESYISFNIQPVHTDFFNFLNTGLSKGIILNQDLEFKITPFPSPVTAKLKVFRVKTVG